MTLREQQPDVAAMVPSVLDQPATRLHQPLLQAGFKPVSDQRSIRRRSTSRRQRFPRVSAITLGTAYTDLAPLKS
jgi:hypothetical protein